MAPVSRDEGAQRDEVRQRIESLYDQAENATGNYNATRAMASVRRSRGVPLAKRPGRRPDPALDEVARQWFDAARAALGPTVPAVLPADRLPDGPSGTGRSRLRLGIGLPGGARDALAAGPSARRPEALERATERTVAELTAGRATDPESLAKAARESARAALPGPRRPELPSAGAGLAALAGMGVPGTNGPESTQPGPATPAGADAPGIPVDLVGVGPTGLDALGPSGLGAVDPSGLGAVGPTGLGAVDPTGLGPSGPAALGHAGPAALGLGDPTALSPAGPAALGLGDPTALSPAGPTALSPAGPAALGALEPAALGSVEPAGVGLLETAVLPVAPPPPTAQATAVGATAQGPRTLSGATAPGRPSPSASKAGNQRKLAAASDLISRYAAQLIGSVTAFQPAPATPPPPAPVTPATPPPGTAVPSTPASVSAPAFSEAASGQWRQPAWATLGAPATATPAADALSDAATAPLTDTGSFPPVPESAGALRAAKAIAFARAQIGKPCVWGAMGPGSYDCSSLTQAAWKAAGVTLPRAAHQQALAGAPVDLAGIEPGDLVLFFDDDRHVGLHVGGGMMVHAPGPGATIREESIYGAGESAIHRVVRPA